MNTNIKNVLMHIATTEDKHTVDFLNLIINNTDLIIRLKDLDERLELALIHLENASHVLTPFILSKVIIMTAEKNMVYMEHKIVNAKVSNYLDVLKN